MAIDQATILQMLQQIGQVPSQEDTNTTTLPQMPGQNVPQSQGPQIPQPTPQTTTQTPTTSPDDFENSIINELHKNTTENLQIKKRQEYLSNLGIKPGKENSFGSILKKAFKEYGVSSDAQKAGTPYRTPNERFQDSAQAEYEKTYPLLKGEVSEIMKNRRQTAKDASLEKVNKEKLDAQEIIKTREEKRKALLDNAKAARTLGLMGLDENKAYQAQSVGDLNNFHLEQEKSDPFSKNDTPIMKTFKRAQKIAEDTGVPFKDVLDQISNITKATKPDNSAFGKIIDDPNLMKTYKEMHPTRPNIFMLPSTTIDKEGNRTNTMTPIDKNAVTPGKPIDLGQGSETRSTRRDQIDEDMGSTDANANIALSSVLNNIRNKALGKPGEDYTGVAEGNPLVEALRARGIMGDTNGKAAGEAIMDTFRGTTAYKHVRGQLGTTRPGQQIIQETESNIGKKSMTNESLARGLSSIAYSAQMAKDHNNNLVKPGDLGPEHSKAMVDEINKAINIAKNPSVPIYMPKRFSDIHKDVVRSRAITKPTTPRQRLEQKYGVQ